MSKTTTKLKPASEVTACVVCHGQFVAVARKLGEQFKKVYYWTPTERSFPTVQEAVIGDGFPEIEWVESFWDIKDKVDCFIFPDIGFSGEQRELIKQGYPVWGARDSDSLETNRGKFLRTLEQLGMDVPHYEKVIGLDNLKLHLKDKTDKYIKISRWRGNFETTHWISWSDSEAGLDKYAVEFGAVKNKVAFYVFDPIKTDIEDGIDAYCIDGKFPQLVLHGVELKDCYDVQTEVMTSAGWKFFKDLDGSEEMLTLDISNPKYYKQKYERPTAFIRDSYSGKMLSLESDNYSLLVTPNHKLLLQVNSQDQSRKIVEWTGIDGVSRKFHQGKRNRKLVAAKDVDFSKVQKMPWPTSARFQGRSTTFKRFKFGDVSLKRSQLARFLGIYLSEGWTNGRKIMVAQSKYFPEMEGVLKDCGFKYHIVTYQGNKTGFGISNIPLAEYLMQFGKSAQKHVPEWLKNSRWQVIEEFLHWYCLGDGSFYSVKKRTRNQKKEKTSRKYYTISRRMADDLQELLAKCGQQSLIREEVANNKPRFIITERSVQNKNYILPQHSKWVDYSGEIFCVTVPSHVILIRRNGKSAWCGNSAYLGTMCAWDELPEQVRSVSEQFAPALKDYRSAFSTEVRIAGDKNYFIDPTCRFPSPPHQLETEMFTNLADIIWHGANGICIDPIPAAKFGVQALLSITRNKTEWVSLSIPKEIERWVKCGFCCQVDGKLTFPPNPLETMAGYLVATGDSIQEAIDNLKKYAAQLPEGFKCEDKSLAELLKEIQSMNEKGITFTTEPVPEPSSVVDE